MTSPSSSAQCCGAIFENVKDVIRSNYVYLIDNIRVEDVLDQLLQEYVLECDDCQRVRYEKTDQTKVRCLLSILTAKSDVDHLKFIHALKEPAPHIWRKLTETETEGYPRKFSVTMQEPETLKIFLEMCASDLLQEQSGKKLKLESIVKKFQHEKETCGLPQGELKTELVLNVIKQVFPNVNLWHCASQKRKKKIDQSSMVSGLTRKARENSLDDFEDMTKGETAATTPHGSKASIETWTTEDVCKWLTSLGVDEDIIKTFREEKISGDVLATITHEEVKQICPGIKFGNLKRIINARNNESEQLEPKSLTMPKDIVWETPRPFDQEESRTTVYRKGRYLPSPNKHAGNPLERIQVFSDILHHTKASSALLKDFRYHLSRFAAACLNERNNGTLYFGVKEDGLIVGLEGERSVWKDNMTKSIRTFFCADQIEKVSKCIRPLRFVEVTDGELRSDSKWFVVEVDIVPASAICEEDVFFIKKPEKRQPKTKDSGLYLFRIKDGNPVELPNDGRAVLEFYSMKDKLCANRREEEEKRKSRTGVESCDKLRQLLCRGEDTLDGDIFPILVLSPFPNSYPDADIKGKFQFMKDLPWKVVFDFDDGARLFCYLEESEEQVLKVLKIEDFDQSYERNQKNKDRLQNILQDLKNSSHRPWIFTNGYKAEELPVHNVVKWKQQRSEGFKEAVRYLKHDIPKGRAVVVFMLFSKDYDVMLEAADELATKFANQWFTLAAESHVAECWLNGLQQKHLVEDKSDLLQQSVIGLPWDHVNDTINNIVGTVADDTCELPTSSGAIVKLSNKMRNDWSDLEILSARQCENAKDVDTEFASETELNFYRGGEVDWWNFYFKSHVLERACFSKIQKAVADALHGTEEDERIKILSLFHQPGAGGTTTAKQVLWSLKGTYRCAVVKQISNQTCDQISRLHSYHDAFPKPVLLLFDNMDEERISALRAELDESAKQISHSSENNIGVAFCVFLLCIRKTEIPDQIGLNLFRLKHELTDAEQDWFKTKYVKLKEKYEKNAKSGINPKHLISFNIMKENFNPEFISKTVKDLIKEISIPAERILLKYISLLNAYDLGFQSLPASAFDAIMEKDEDTYFMKKQRWELHLSQSLKILLYQVKKKNPAGQHLRIIHNALSKQIIDILIQEQNNSPITYQSPLCAVFTEFLESGIFAMTYPDNSVEQLLKVARDVVKKRARNIETGKPETKFAPIIEDILKESKEDVDDAASIIKKIYELSDDVFTGQQLARLYIHSKNWDQAKYYASEITRKKPENSYLWDTYGNAFKEQIKEKYSGCLESQTGMSPKDASCMLDLAFEAVCIFQKEQEVSETEKTTYINNAGYYQELQVVIIMLDCLSLTVGLDENILHQILVGGRAMPEMLMKTFGQDRVSRLLQIESGVNKTLARLEDEHLQLRDEMADVFRKNQQRISKEQLIKYKESLEHHYGEYDDKVPDGLSEEEKCKYRRRRVFRLAGNTFCAVFELRKKDQAVDILQKIRALIDQNMDSAYKTSFDLQMLISINLTLCCLGKNVRQSIKHEEMAELAATLYEERTKGTEQNLEPYLFAAMLNWPFQQNPANKRQHIPAQEIPGILKNWRSAYYNKYPRQRESTPYKKKETTIFFLGNGEGMNGFAFDGELRIEGIRRNNVHFWNHPHVVKRLERWSGILINDGFDVKITIMQSGNKLPLTIPTSMPISNKNWFGKKVYFVIGFTWTGPKAFDVRIQCPEEVPDAINLPKSNAKQHSIRQREPFSDFKNINQMKSNCSKLQRELLDIENAAKNPSNLGTHESKRLQRKKRVIQIKYNEMKATLLKAVEELYTNY